MKQEIYCHQCAKAHPIGEHSDMKAQAPQQSAPPQDGTNVAGYRKLTNAEIMAMNDVKETSRYFLATLDQLAGLLPDIDKRWLAIARTDMQTACMAACRAIARPSEDS